MISANYFDGLSARLHPVNLELGAGEIGLAGVDIVRSYPFSEATLAEPFARAACVLDFADGGRCEIADPDAKAAIASALGYRKSRVVRWQDHWYGAVLALVLLVATIAATVQWGIPALTTRVVASLPVSLDQDVGDAAFKAVSGEWFSKSRFSDQRLEEIGEVFRVVAPFNPRLPLRLYVMDSEHLAPNAVAFPDGRIIITDSMIMHILGGERYFNDDSRAMLAGVLAHEIGHIEGRHSVRVLARSSLLAVLSATLFGDFSAVVAGTPALVLNMHYSREMELKADQYAIGRLQALGWPPAALADLFESLEELDPGQDRAPAWMQDAGDYLSSHPPTQERSNNIRRAGKPPED